MGLQDRYNTGMMAKVLGVGKWGSVKLVTDKVFTSMPHNNQAPSNEEHTTR